MDAGQRRTDGRKEKGLTSGKRQMAGDGSFFLPMRIEGQTEGT